MQRQERERNRPSVVALGLLAATLLASASAAQEATKSKPEDAPTSPMPKTVNLWPGVAPGSERWKQPEAALRPGTIVNVTTPTLTVYSPTPSTATGTAVIIAPGGGFVGLSIDSEGHDVAAPAATAGACASRARRAITGSTSSIGGWKRRA